MFAEGVAVVDAARGRVQEIHPSGVEDRSELVAFTIDGAMGEFEVGDLFAIVLAVLDKTASKA